MNMCPEKALIRDLLKGYVNYTRPIVEFITPKKVYNCDNVAYQLVVEFGISLLQILGLREMDQILSTSVRLLYKWTDVLLSWDPRDYRNVTDIRLPAEKIWLPDILLYNYADERLEEVRETDVRISYDGTVYWSPLAIYRSTCQVKTEYFPYDEQSCSLKFGTWSYDGYRLNMTFFNNTEYLILNELISSPEWRLERTSAKFNEKNYTCCPEPYSDLTYKLVISRQSSFYTYILIIPCFLLNWLTLVLFWLPPESPAKLVLGMNMFVAFFLLLLILEEYVPSSSNDFPLIGTYYCVNMIIITMSMFLCLITVNFHFRGDIRKEVPTWIKRLANHPVMAFMGAQVPDYHKEEMSLPPTTAFQRPPPAASKVYEENVHYCQCKSSQRMPKGLSKKIKVYNEYEQFRRHDRFSTDSSYRRSFSSVSSGCGIYSSSSCCVDEDEADENNACYDCCESDESQDNYRPYRLVVAMNPDFQIRLRRINQDLRNMMRSLEWLRVMQKQDQKIARINSEWRSVAVLFDRIFFIISMISILICMTLFYPRAASIRTTD